MSQIKLKHSGGNSSIIAAPSSNPASDVTFRLPNADGTAGQVLKTDGSGNLSFGADTGGLFASYAIIVDQKSSGTDGGSSSGGNWNTRDLNTELSDPDGIVSISSNQFTLQAGSYFLEAAAPSYKPNRHKLKLYQTSGTPADIAFGTSEFVNQDEGIQSTASLSCRFTISTATTYEIRHYIQTSKSGNGLGVAISAGVEYFCIVKIFKEV